MGFTQKSFIDLEIAKKELPNLMEVSFDELRTDFQDAGASGHVHKVTLLNKGEVVKELIFKKEQYDFAYFKLYKDVLEPLDLNSPKIYGEVRAGEDEFLVMDYINYLPAEWDNPQRSLKALNWLIKKDLAVKKNFELVKNLDYIPQNKEDKTSMWTKAINDGLTLKAHPLVTQKLVDTLLTHEKFLHQIFSDLSQKDNLTLNHNDVQMYNVLFTPDDQIFVIDWSEVNIGNVCVDLAHLVNVSPDEVKQEMIETYKKQNSFSGFDELFLRAQLVDHLGNLNWMVSTFLDGQGKNISVEDMKKRIDFILNFKYV